MTRRPHLGPRAFRGPRPELSGKERGAGPGLRRQSPAHRGCAAATGLLAASAPSPRPCPGRRSRAKLARSGFLLCNPVQSKSRPNAAPPMVSDCRAKRRNQRAARPKPKLPSPALLAAPRSARPAPYALRGPSPHRASALIIPCSFASCLSDAPKKSRCDRNQRRLFRKFLPTGT